MLKAKNFLEIMQSTSEFIVVVVVTISQLTLNKFSHDRNTAIKGYKYLS